MKLSAGLSSEKLRPEHLLIADFQNVEGHYANAILWNYLVATAGHVADSEPKIMRPSGAVGDFWFRRIPGRDLAISTNTMPLEKGFSQHRVPRKGEVIVVCGHHGPQRNYFEIQAVVIGFDTKKRIVVEAIPRMGLQQSKKLHRKLVPEDFDNYFQLGMSGSPGINTQEHVLGLLSEGAGGDFKGHRIVLEPAWFLK